MTDNERLDHAKAAAQLIANRTGQAQRIFRAYSAYCVRPVGAQFFGTSLAIVQPAA